MKLHRMEHYDAGYSDGSGIGCTLLKGIAATTAAAALLGGLTACGDNSLMGDVVYDGYMSVESVSDSDIAGTPSPSSDEEMFTIDGDVAYVPSGQD